MVCPEGLAVSVSALAATLSKGKSADELSLLGAVFTQLGDTLATIAAVKSLAESSEKEPSGGKSANYDTPFCPAQASI